MTALEKTVAAEDSARRYWVLAICFLIVVLDGLDTTSIAFVAPILSKVWSMDPSAFTPAFVATSIGAVVGYMSSGRIVAGVGLRTASIAMVFIFGLGTLATAYAWDITSLSALRFFSAIGLGGVLPIAIAAGTAAFPPHRKETITMIVASGLSAGAVAGGLMGGPLMRTYGWESIFMVGGILPILMLPLFLGVLPNSEALSISGESPSQTSVKSLFSDALPVKTSLLWTFAFLVFLVTYALTFWIPTLLVELGYPREMAPLGAAAFGTGGLVGNIIVMLLVGRIGISRLLIATTILAMLFVVLTSQAGPQSTMTFILIGALGATLISGCVGQAALAVSLYNPAQRITGIGWAAALGRIGSIVGPAIGGALLAFGYAAQNVIMTALVPGVLATIVLVIITLRK